MQSTIIIGGGPAGSAAAILLARQGIPVTLLEREKTARHKVCGEFISSDAGYYLEALGIDLVSLGAEKIDTVRLVRGKNYIENKLPFKAYSLSRCRLDEALLQEAEKVGAHIRRGIVVTGFEKNAEWRITSAGENFFAHRVILASGKHDIRGWSRPQNRRDVVGFKMHYILHKNQRRALQGCVELLPFEGGYIGLEPVEDERANLCLVVNKKNFRDAGKSWPLFLSMLCNSLPHLALRLCDAKACWTQPLAVAGIPYGFVYKPDRAAPLGLFRLGDQMGVIPSFAGDGLAIALHTAHLAMAHIITNDAKKYHQRAYGGLSHQIGQAQVLLHLQSSRLGRALIFGACRLWPNLLVKAAGALRLMPRLPGKPDCYTDE